MTEMEKLFRRIVGVIAETDSGNNDKAIRIFLEFHSYLLDNSPAYLEDDYDVDFNDIINVMEARDKPETGWTLVKYTYDGDHKVYDTLYHGTKNECAKYGFDNYPDLIGICLLDPQQREWDL